ncbi:MAG: hypothetical protein NW224_26475 [Leptolyngbyaceae cyanobacterium bins.302]|nr:hypothetical protein [Leptolyngbyaceae cyanobacterium bins.302]
MIGGFLSFSGGFSLLVLLAFAVLQWFHIPAGSFLDWLIGAASFWWLIVIVTVPWNIHFEAKSVLADAAESQRQGIEIDSQQVQYAATIAQRSLWVAIALHLLSAIGLYGLAIAGISAIGYVSSGAALLLTVLRPAIELYRYLATRLGSIRRTFRYPREDVMELRDRLMQLEHKVDHLDYQLNLDHADGFAATQQRLLTALRQDLTQLAATQEDFKVTNQADHERLSREARTAIAQLSTDGEVLNHVREIIQFFKNA